jgi:hypothetical protein
MLATFRKIISREKRHKDKTVHITSLKTCIFQSLAARKEATVRMHRQAAPAGGTAKKNAFFL